MPEFTHFAVVRLFSYEVYGVGKTADEARQWAAVHGGAVLQSNGNISYGFEELAVLPCTEAFMRSYHAAAKRMGFNEEMHHIIGIISKQVGSGIGLAEEIESNDRSA